MEHSGRSAYPFTAIVGQEAMKKALLLVAVQPAIGGVLILGERGTAKTTAVRAMPDILGEGMRVVELPLNATEDRVVGTLHVGSLMKSGEREFLPGILSDADGQILYVDEINLLEDHIVDLLLDAAATGVCRVEREGMSEEYPARFVLVGTMNPEEGTLRPQLLDRFGLSVRVTGNLTQQERLEVVRRQEQFEADAEAFCARFADNERRLAERLFRAKELYPHVAFPDDVAMFSSGICSEMSIDGYRADIALMRAARAMAALGGRDCASREDVLAASRFVLPHRLKRSPFEEVSFDDKVLERAMSALEERELDAYEAKAEEDEVVVECVPIGLPAEKANEVKKP
ncbi:MAG: AAA family ATPase [Eggerthellaceae bacterium]|nr:AAA family ATPase [Eggerthellaceae bacterium]